LYNSLKNKKMRQHKVMSNQNVQLGFARIVATKQKKYDAKTYCHNCQKYLK